MVEKGFLFFFRKLLDQIIKNFCASFLLGPEEGPEEGPEGGREEGRVNVSFLSIGFIGSTELVLWNWFFLP